MLEVIASGIF